MPRITSTDPLIKAAAKHLGIPVSSIGHIMLHVDTPMGTMVLHTLPTASDYKNLMIRMAHDESLIDLTDSTDQ